MGIFYSHPEIEKVLMLIMMTFRTPEVYLLRIPYLTAYMSHGLIRCTPKFGQAFEKKI